MEHHQISPQDFIEKLDAGDIQKSQIIDVREQHEWAYYHLEGSKHMPMNSIPNQLDVLSKGEDLYIICAHGVRSDMVSQFLTEQGFDRVINVQGGMAAVSALRDFQYD